MNPLWTLCVTLCAVAGCLAGRAGNAEARKAPPQSFEAWDCNRTSGSTNLMSERIFIIRDKATNAISVVDDLIYTVNAKQPIVATVKGDTATRLDIAWTVNNVPLRNDSPARAMYQLTFFKGTLTYTEGIVLAGYGNTESSNGTCKLAQ